MSTDYVWTPTETLDKFDDDGTMVESAAALAKSVVGHRIVKVEKGSTRTSEWSDRRDPNGLRLTLDTGRVVTLGGGSDCCAYTELNAFLFNADKVDHVITGLSTENGYERWHIFADAGDVLELTVSWSCGNPFYYGYGFYINVEEPS